MSSATPFNGPSLYETLRLAARWNLPPEELVRQAVTNGEGVLTRDGALRVMTGTYTGRSPRDKYTVRRPPSAEHVDWSSKFSNPLDPEPAEALVARFAREAEKLP